MPKRNNRGSSCEESEIGENKRCKYPRIQSMPSSVFPDMKISDEKIFTYKITEENFHIKALEDESKSGEEPLESTLSIQRSNILPTNQKVHSVLTNLGLDNKIGTSNIQVKEEDSDDDVIILGPPPLQTKIEKKEIIIIEDEEKIIHENFISKNLINHKKVKTEPSESLKDIKTTSNVSTTSSDMNVLKHQNFENNGTNCFKKNVQLLHHKKRVYLNLNIPLMFDDLNKIIKHLKALDVSLDTLESDIKINNKVKVERPCNCERMLKDKSSISDHIIKNNPINLHPDTEQILTGRKFVYENLSLSGWSKKNENLITPNTNSSKPKIDGLTFLQKNDKNNVSRSTSDIQINFNELKKIVETFSSPNLIANVPYDKTLSSVQNNISYNAAKTDFYPVENVENIYESERKKIKSTPNDTVQSNWLKSTNADFATQQSLSKTDYLNLHSPSSNINIRNVEKTVYIEKVSSSNVNISRETTLIINSNDSPITIHSGKFNAANINILNESGSENSVRHLTSLYTPLAASIDKTKHSCQPTQSALSRYLSTARSLPIQSSASIVSNSPSELSMIELISTNKPHQSSTHLSKLMIHPKDRTSVKNFHSFIRKKNIQEIDVIILILGWKTEWLKLSVSEVPDLISIYIPIIDSYYSFENYYNTYLPFHLLSMWYNLYKYWDDYYHVPDRHFHCRLKSQDKKPDYVKCTAYSVIVKDSQLNNCPRRGMIVLITFQNEKKFEKSVFGYIVNVLQKNYHGKSTCSKKKVKFVFYISTSLNVNKIDILSLYNIRVNVRQIEGLQSLRNSVMCPLILNPKNNITKMKKIRIEYDHRFDVCLDRVYNCISSHETEILLLEMSPAAQPLLTVFRIFEKIKDNSVVMICVRKHDRFLKLSAMFIKHNLVLAVKASEVEMPESLKVYTLREQADVRDISVENQSSEILKRSKVILTILDSMYLDNTESVLSKIKLTCVIDDANTFTEIQTLVPFIYNIEKLILIGKSTDCIEMPEFLEKHSYNKSLYNRLDKSFLSL